jgi:hypothetical protein
VSGWRRGVGGGGGGGDGGGWVQKDPPRYSGRVVRVV